MRLGAPAVAEIKSQLLGSLRTVPKTILERGRQAVDLIAAVQRFSARLKITWFSHAEIFICRVRGRFGVRPQRLSAETSQNETSGPEYFPSVRRLHIIGKSRQSRFKNKSYSDCISFAYLA